MQYNILFYVVLFHFLYYIILMYYIIYVVFFYLSLSLSLSLYIYIYIYILYSISISIYLSIYLYIYIIYYILCIVYCICIMCYMCGRRWDLIIVCLTTTRTAFQRAPGLGFWPTATVGTHSWAVAAIYVGWLPSGNLTWLISMVNMVLIWFYRDDNGIMMG